VADDLAALRPLLDDPEDDVRVAAAEALARRDVPDAFRTLGRLLDSEELSVRNRSIMLLRTQLKLTKPFSAYAPESLRRRHAEDWRAAIETRLQELSPLAPPAGTGAPPASAEPPSTNGAAPGPDRSDETARPAEPDRPVEPGDPPHEQPVDQPPAAGAGAAP
jgi:hypothetical protein